MTGTQRYTRARVLVEGQESRDGVHGFGGDHGVVASEEHVLPLRTRAIAFPVEYEVRLSMQMNKSLARKTAIMHVVQAAMFGPDKGVWLVVLTHIIHIVLMEAALTVVREVCPFQNQDQIVTLALVLVPASVVKPSEKHTQFQVLALVLCPSSLMDVGLLACPNLTQPGSKHSNLSSAGSGCRPGSASRSCRAIKAVNAFFFGPWSSKIGHGWAWLSRHTLLEKNMFQNTLGTRDPPSSTPAFKHLA